jgi:hypothetical protein
MENRYEKAMEDLKHKENDAAQIDQEIALVKSNIEKLRHVLEGNPNE